LKVILHADDFGYNKEVSEDILDCFYNGTLDSISIMPNSTYFEECMEMLSKKEADSGLSNGKNLCKLQKTIHFSISEGPCVSDKEKLPLLVNDKGMFKLSFFKLLLMTMGPKRKELKKELKAELSAQLNKCLPYIDGINVDSHVHYHMIPLVFNTLMEVCEETGKVSGKEIGYVRNPAEPLSPFIKNVSLYSSYDFINIIKNIVLNFLAFLNNKNVGKYMNTSAVFFGIVMSGHMDIDRVSKLLPDFIKIAEKRGMDLEVLAHPGHTTDKSTVLDTDNEEYAKAPLSENRLIEKKMFMEISKYLWDML